MPTTPRVALVCSAHGLGHLTRQLALAEGLSAEGAEPVVFTAAPQVASDYLPGLAVEPWTADVGLVQRDSLHLDLPATIAALEERCGEQGIQRLAQALAGFDLAVVDTAPAALEAARRAGIPSLAMGNFDWAWIYGHYPELSSWAARFRAWQAPHRAVALAPGPGLFCFARVEPGGLIGRQRRAWRPADRTQRHALVSFGGSDLGGVDALLPRVPGLRWVLVPPMNMLDRPDCTLVAGVDHPALVAGVDVVLTKPGYSTYAECALAGTPIVWAPRPGFPEAPYLEAAMRVRGDQAIQAAVDRPQEFRSELARVVQQRLARPAPAPVDGLCPQKLARRVLAEVGPPRY